MEGRETNQWLITIAVMLPTMIEILDTSVANVSLPNIQGSVSAGRDEVTWVLTSYLVSNAIVIPMSGWLARAFGRKRFLIGSIILFTISSVLCGSATSLTQIVVFRVIQGIGGGGLQPMSQAILLETFPPQKRGLAMGIFGMGAVLGPILGPLVGGYLTDNYSWRWIFYVNLPLGILAMILISIFVFDPEYQERRATGEKIDYIGFSLLAVGLGSLQIVLDKGQRDDWFSSNFIVTLSVVAIVCIVLLIFRELSQERPILDLRVFKDRSFATGSAIMFVTFFSFLGSLVLLPLYLQTVMGYTAFLAGLVLGPGGAITLLMLPLAGRLSERIDARLLLVFGLTVTAYSIYYMSGFTGQIDFRTAVISRVLQGVGMPFIFVMVAYLTMAYIPKEQMNNASGIFNLLRNLGGSFGVAFISTVLERRSQFHQYRLVEHLTPYDTGYSQSLDSIGAYLNLKMGALPAQANAAAAAIYQELHRQATILAFRDAFYLQAVFLLILVGTVWIIRRPPRHQASKPLPH